MEALSFAFFFRNPSAKTSLSLRISSSSRALPVFIVVMILRPRPTGEHGSERAAVQGRRHVCDLTVFELAPLADQGGSLSRGPGNTLFCDKTPLLRPDPGKL